MTDALKGAERRSLDTDTVAGADQTDNTSATVRIPTSNPCLGPHCADGPKAQYSPPPWMAEHELGQLDDPAVQERCWKRSGGLKLDYHRRLRGFSPPSRAQAPNHHDEASSFSEMSGSASTGSWKQASCSQLPHYPNTHPVSAGKDGIVERSLAKGVKALKGLGRKMARHARGRPAVEVLPDSFQHVSSGSSAGSTFFSALDTAIPIADGQVWEARRRRTADAEPSVTDHG